MIQPRLQFGFFVLLLVGASACVEPTQVTFDITTDLDCTKVNGTSITVGVAGVTEKAPPVSVLRECRADGTVGLIGTYAVVPKGNKEVVAAIKVSVAVGDTVDVETDCTADNHYAGCIVARRQVNFIPRRSLVVPVQMFLVCKGVACDEGSTCNRAGRCVSARVDTTTCDPQGKCADLVTAPGEGLPCFNTGLNDTLFCTGATPWCTRDDGDVRACRSGPGVTGVSFQCRVDTDCQAGMQCRPGNIGGVLGMCQPGISATAPSLQGVSITDASPTNHASLSLTYTGLVGPIAQFCVLENASTVAACVWQNGTALPPQYTPVVTSGNLVLGVAVKNSLGETSSLVLSNQIVLDRVVPSVALTSPLGGERWPAASQQQLAWTASDNLALTATPITLEFSLDDGATWQSIGSSLTGSSFSWTTPTTSSAQARVRVTAVDTAGNTAQATSGLFRVGTPALSVASLQVNAGAVVTNNATLALTWGFVSDVISKYCINLNDADVMHCNWVNATALPATLTVPAVDGDKTLSAWVGNSTGETSAIVSSNTVFLDQTAPAVAWVAPVGGEVFAAGAHALTWTAADSHLLATSPISIEVSLDNGTTFTALAGPLANTPATFMWVPTITSTQVRLRITATDSAGNTARSTTGQLQVDSTVPSVASLSVNSGATTTNSPFLSLTWGLVNDVFTKYCINLNDTLVADCAWVSASSLPATFTVPTVEGSKTLTAWLMDAAGNVSVPVTSNSVVLDRTPPLASWTSPAGGEVWSGTAHALTWTASDALGLAATPIAIELSTNNGTTWTPLAGPLSNTPASYGWTPTAINSAQVRVRLTANDAAGNSITVTSSSFTVDTTPPSVASLQLNAGAATTINPSLNLSWGAPSEPFTRYCINLNDSQVGNCLWTTASTLPAMYTVASVDGPKVLTAWLMDAAGNVSSAVTSNSILLDQTAPTVSWTSPVGGESWATASSRSITWTASDLQGLAANPVSISVSTDNGGTWTLVAAGVSNATGSYSWTTPATATAQAKLRITVVDAAGNSTIVVSNAFSLVVQTPMLSGVVLSGGGTETNSATMSVSFTGASSFSRYCININDVSIGNCAWVTSSTLPTSVTVPNTDGNKTLTVWLEGSPGIRVGPVTSNTVYLDTTAPTVAWTGVITGQLWSTGLAHVLTWSASDAHALATTPIVIELSLNNGTSFSSLAGPLSNAPASYSWTPAVGTVSQAVLRITATDRVGNTRSVVSGAFSLSDLSWNPLTNNFGSVAVDTPSATASFTLTNGGAAPATGCTAPSLSNVTDFTIMGDTCGTGSLSSLGTCVVTVRANPRAAGGRSSTLSRTCSTGGTSEAVSLTVTGTGSPPIRWNVASVDFGEVNTTKSSYIETIYFQNPGIFPSVNCGAPALSNTTNFTLVSDDCGILDVAPAGQCSVRVKANPTTAGPKAANLTRTCNGTLRSVGLSVSGTTAYLTAITGNGDGTCGRMSDGTVRCWGANIYGAFFGNGSGTRLTIPGVVSTIATATAVVTGQYGASCALLADRTVKCWGYNQFGQIGDGTTTNRYTPVSVQGIATATQLAMGAQHVCALLLDQTVQCWGSNGSGQLGNGTGIQSNVPVAVSGLTGVTQIAAGMYGSCAVTASGMQCWGQVLGMNVTPTPVSINGLTGIQSLVLGQSHACTLMTDTTVKCWGSNSQGQLGDGTTVDRFATPAAVPGLSNVQSLAAGDYFNCARMTDQTVKCWGDNSLGQLGDLTQISRPVPTPMTGVTTAVDVSGGSQHACVLLADHSVNCWGAPQNVSALGVLGDGNTSTRRALVATPSMTGITSIMTSGQHACAVMNDQTVRCWGNNSPFFSGDGQLGDGTSVTSPTPVVVSGLTNIKTVIGAGGFACALGYDGAVHCWGRALNLGNGSNTVSRVPVATLVSGMTQIVAGDTHSCGVKNDQTVWCWGSNYTGELGDGTTSAHSVPMQVLNISTATAVSAGSQFGCALLQDQTVQCWGLNTSSQLGDGTTTNRLNPVPVTGLTGVQAIASGGYHSCALMADATVKCWGGNYLGQIGDGTASNVRATPVSVLGVANVTRVVSGQDFSCALLTNGTLKCWGGNDYNQLGESSGTIVISTPISLPGSGAPVDLMESNGVTHTLCTIRQGTGGLFCVGDNSYSQTGDLQNVTRTVSGF